MASVLVGGTAAVAAPALAPVQANPVVVSTTRYTPIDIDLTAHVTGGGENGYTLAGAAPTQGDVTITAAGIATYTPTGSTLGTDTFGYQVTDAGGRTATATVTITLTNAPPVITAEPAEVVAERGKPVTFRVTLRDVDSMLKTASYQGAGRDFSATLAPGLYIWTWDVTLTPPTGTDLVFSLAGADYEGASVRRDIPITVTTVAPTAADVTVDAIEDSDVVVALDGTAHYGDPLTYEIVTAASHGALYGIDDQHRRYVPRAEYSGCGRRVGGGGRADGWSGRG